MSETFAVRLNRLFETVFPPSRGPHSSAELIAALNAQGIRTSAPYIAQLRAGVRANPSGVIEIKPSPHDARWLRRPPHVGAGPAASADTTATTVPTVAA